MHKNLGLLLGSLGLIMALTTNTYAESKPNWTLGKIILLNGKTLEGEINFKAERTQLFHVVYLREKNSDNTYNVRGYYFKEIQKVIYYDQEWQTTRTLARYNNKFYEKLVGNSDDLHFLVVPHKHLGAAFKEYVYLSYFIWDNGEVKYISNFPKQFRKLCEKYQVDYRDFIKNVKLSPNDPNEQRLLVYYFNKWRKNDNLIVKN